LSERTGLDFSRFPNYESAQAAYDMRIEQYARAGLNQPAPVNPAPVGNLADPDDGIDEDDDIVEDDILAPEPAKPRKRSKYEKQLEKRLAALEKRTTEAARQQEEAIERQIITRAIAAMDKMAAPQLGVGANRSVGQRFAAQNLYQLAKGIAQGALQFGERMTIEEAIDAAARHLGIKPGSTGLAPELVAPAPAAEVPPPEPRSGNLALPAGVAPTPRPIDSRFGGLAAYVNDPEFRAAAARIGK
jgi:hypothetical protein